MSGRVAHCRGPSRQPAQRSTCGRPQFLRPQPIGTPRPEAELTAATVLPGHSDRVIDAAPVQLMLGVLDVKPVLSAAGAGGRLRAAPRVPPACP
jgi:hypothetical protein